MEVIEEGTQRSWPAARAPVLADEPMPPGQGDIVDLRLIKDDNNSSTALATLYLGSHSSP